MMSRLGSYGLLAHLLSATLPSYFAKYSTRRVLKDIFERWPQVEGVTSVAMIRSGIHVNRFL